MSGFSADWLALREAADARSRSARLIGAAARDLAAVTAPVVCDLGAGTGAARRAMAGVFPAATAWVLVDDDPALLARAAAPGVALRRADLAADPAPWPAGCRLVTATALFDLAAAAWLDRLAAALAAARRPLLSCLSYDGRIALSPAHPLDVAMIRAFNAHQRTDKGLGGPAAGPEAHGHLVRALQAQGFDVAEDDTPWRLSAAEDGAMIDALLSGWAGAVVGMAGVTADMAADWLAARRGDTAALAIGHRDLYARPPA